MKTENLETLRGIAAIICEIDALPSGDVERITQQLRSLHQARRLKPSTAGGPRGAWLFGLHEACRARILLELIDLGMAGDSIQAALDDFNYGCTGARMHPATVLGVAIERSAAGKECVFQVTVFTTPGKGKELTAKFDWPGRTTAHAKRILAAKYRNQKTHAVVTLPVTDLLRPLIEKWGDS